MGDFTYNNTIQQTSATLLKLAAELVSNGEVTKKSQFNMHYTHKKPNDPWFSSEANTEVQSLSGFSMIMASSCRMMRLLDSENQLQSSLVTVTGITFCIKPWV